MAFTQAIIASMGDEEVLFRLECACAQKLGIAASASTASGPWNWWVDPLGYLHAPRWWKLIKDYQDATNGTPWPSRRYAMVTQDSLGETAACLGFDGVPETWLDNAGILATYRSMLLWACENAGT